MAKVKGPLLSVTASGTIGKTLTYAKSGGVNVVKGSYLKKVNGYYFTRELPVNESIKQKSVRCCFSGARKAWNVLTEEEKQAYKDEACGKALTGYNIFVSNYINTYYDYQIYLIAYLFALSFELPVLLWQIGCNKEIQFSWLNDSCN